MKRLHGMVCAMITPMKENGEIDFSGIAALCEALAVNGVHCLYPNGTNGESLLLRAEERQAVAQQVAAANRQRCALYIQCGAVTPEETCAHIRHARKIGADGAGVMTPVFFLIDDRATERYFEEALAQAPDFPMYVYNIAFRTGVDVPSGLLGGLMARHSNLYGIKFSSSDLLRLQEYISCCPARRPDVLIGNDGLALSCLAAGGAGYVSGPGAAFPRQYAAIYNAFAAGEFAEAQAAQRRVLAIMKRMRGIPEIPAIKYLLWKQDVIASPVCRRPFRVLDACERQQLNDLMAFARG